MKDGVGKAFLNSGQTCSALTRMLVPRDRLGEAEAVAAAAAQAVVVGDPFSEGVHLGPLASAAQRERVNSYIDRGIEEGATVVAGGPGAPEGLERGYYVRPTVFSGVTPDMTIAQEEIFGPVLSILPYDGEDDAVEIANGVVYGLAGGVWSADPGRAEAVARRLRTGQVEVNGGAFNPTRPSAATSSPASAASTDGSASKSSWRSRASSAEGEGRQKRGGRFSLSAATPSR